MAISRSGMLFFMSGVTFFAIVILLHTQNSPTHDPLGFWPHNAISKRDIVNVPNVAQLNTTPFDGSSLSSSEFAKAENANKAEKMPNSTHSKVVASDEAQDSDGCPPGYLITISAHGRLGNNICQYSTLWALQAEDSRAQPAWVMAEMRHVLEPLFPPPQLPVLPRSCKERNRRFRSIIYRNFASTASTSPDRAPVRISDYPCDLSRFHRHRDTLLPQLTFLPALVEGAQQRLRQHTAFFCQDPSTCTYIGVHVRRTDYVKAVRRMYNGTLVGERYLTQAFDLCRRRYRRPVFVVCSDDLTWVRRHLRHPDVVVAGSTGSGSAGRDMALLTQCNHTVVTHGTFGYMSAFLTQGDILAPTGFGARDSYLSDHLKKTDLNITFVDAF